VCPELPAHLADDLDAGFECLVRDHADLVYGLARRMIRDHHVAEEVAQDAFVRAYRALGGYPEDRVRALRPKAWLARIVLNLSRNHLRDRPAAGVPIDDVTETQIHGDGPADPADLVVRREGVVRMATLLESLPPRYRRAVELRHVQGFSYSELAEVMDRPVNSVKSDVHRGLALLRATLQVPETPPTVRPTAETPEQRPPARLQAEGAALA